VPQGVRVRVSPSVLFINIISMTLDWVSSEDIREEDKNIPIKQIYLWFITKDKKIPIVAGDSGNFQLPGGKPEYKENISETIRREMFEETGIKIDMYKGKPVLFGYYVCKEDPNWPQFPVYLKLRLYFKVEELSSKIPLSLNEREGDAGHMKSVKFADINSLPNEIPWMKNEAEYHDVLRILGL